MIIQGQPERLDWLVRHTGSVRLGVGGRIRRIGYTRCVALALCRRQTCTPRLAAERRPRESSACSNQQTMRRRKREDGARWIVGKVDTGWQVAH